MRPQQEPSTQEVLAGFVERVTFHNSENGFCVLRAKARGHRDLVTVIGHADADLAARVNRISVRISDPNHALIYYDGPKSIPTPEEFAANPEAFSDKHTQFLSRNTKSPVLSIEIGMRGDTIRKLTSAVTKLLSSEEST